MSENDNLEVDAKTAKKQKKNRITGFFKDFKAFISKGNIVDLAVAVVIGAAFGAIVTSLVNDIIMPLISALFKVTQFANLAYTFPNGSILNYGKFIQTVVNFVLIALSIFIMLRILINAQKGLAGLSKKQKKAAREQEAAAAAAKAAEAAQAPATPVKIESQEEILKDIRELLKNMQTKDGDN